MINEKKSPCIWVTRPQAQSETLFYMLVQSGYRTVNFPVIEIEAIKPTAELLALFDHLENYQAIIFVSRNAVNYSFSQFLSADKIPANSNIIAIGNATATTLHEYAINSISCNDEKTDSESLLTLPELQTQLISGKRILLVRGQGGRELLYNTLTSRGATVDLAEVYARTIPKYEEQYLDKLWRENHPDAIIVTSNEGIDNLIALTPEMYMKTLYQIPLVVMSERNASYASDCGFITASETANETSDSGLQTALTSLLEKSHT